jgi:hypothetical protein
MDWIVSVLLELCDIFGIFLHTRVVQKCCIKYCDKQESQDFPPLGRQGCFGREHWPSGLIQVERPTTVIHCSFQRWRLFRVFFLLRRSLGATTGNRWRCNGSNDIQGTQRRKRKLRCLEKILWSVRGDTMILPVGVL